MKEVVPLKEVVEVGFLEQVHKIQCHLDFGLKGTKMCLYGHKECCV